ncbi:MAG: hypothetical protein GY805_38060, partial [Chloroflexi bacterium]|nr:hypothetical protein [Chloroflexota bacterium]
MIPKTLRFRLPLTYAAIALIATLVLGAVLLVTLQRFYRQQELDYLTGNAHVIGERLLPLLQSADMGQLEANIKIFSFLSQTRVQVWTLEDELLADSGDPRQADDNTEISFSVDIDGIEQTFHQPIANSTVIEETETTIFVQPEANDNDVEEQIIEEGVLLGVDEEILEGIEGGSGIITRTKLVTREIVSDVLPVIGTQFGFGFDDG